MRGAARLLAGVLLGVALVGAAWFAGWVDPPERLARRIAVWAAVYPGPVGDAEVDRIECAPLRKARLYAVCTRGCGEIWRVVLVRGLQPTLVANPGRIPAEDPALRRRRMNAEVEREGIRLDTAAARAMAACYLRLEGLEPTLVLPEGGAAMVEETRARGEEAMRAYALGLDEPGAAERIPIEETPEGFASEMPYWDTFGTGHPVLTLRLRLARDGRLLGLAAEPVSR